MVFFTRRAIFKTNAVHHTAVACNFGCLRIGVNGHVVQALEFVHQDCIGFELVGKFYDRDVGHNAGQVDGGFNARVATANDGRAFPFEQGAIAVRAIRHTLVFVLLLARHIDIAPARTR